MKKEQKQRSLFHIKNRTLIFIERERKKKVRTEPSRIQISKISANLQQKATKK